MARVLSRKTALIALVILILVGCVLFACACEREELSVDFSVDGEIVGGASLSFVVTYDGSESAVAPVKEQSCLFEVVTGEKYVQIEDNRLLIADDARKGDVFSIKLTVGSLSATKTFSVQKEKPIVVTSVTLYAKDSAKAGESVELRAEILPEGLDLLPVYTILSGEASVEGNVLKISEDASGGEVVVKATAAGVSSSEKHIAISTIQTASLTLTFPRARAMGGETLSFTVQKQPANSTFPIEYELKKGADLADLDPSRRTLAIHEDAPLGSEIELVVRSGKASEKQTITVGRPFAEEITARGGTVVPDSDRTIEYELSPRTADDGAVRVFLMEGDEEIEWTGGFSFHVNPDATVGAEIVFLLEADEAYTTVTYRIERRVVTSLSISTNDPTTYLGSGASVTFTHQTVPVTSQQVRYRATEGADLVLISENVVTVKEGADIGAVTIVAESEDGAVSNEVSFTVSGRYSRRAYTRWENVSFTSYGETASIWMVLPPIKNADCLTVLVPHEVVDLVIEGSYDGTEESAYKDLYFYFRNTPERTVTLWNFGTIATKGLGGTVFDLGSSGTTEIVLKGQNLIRADSPFYLNNTGEKTDGVWDTGYDADSMQEMTRRSGKPGYRGAAGGTAISGYTLSFSGAGGSLTVVAGDGVNGTPGGKGADAVYDGSFAYLSGAGGAGGNGGDSGAAIYASKVSFLSGLVTAIPGNAGQGGAGGAAGSIAALSSYSVTKASGSAGQAGEDGEPYAAVRAKTVVGNHYLSSVGEVKARTASYGGTLSEFTDRLSRFYGVSVYYGNKLYNPYATKPKSSRYVMTEQTDAATLMQQTNFLMYTMSLMPKNLWKEIVYRSGNEIKIYLCKSITSGGGSVILGLTSKTNNLWFATFETDLRGVYYSGYFNIMLHEFVHVLHYNYSESAVDEFERRLEAYNYSDGKHLDYKSSWGSSEGVYGVNRRYNETNSCFFTNYSRKSVMEDASETVSVAATFSAKVLPMTAGTTLYDKYRYLAESFSREYETLSPFITGAMLFADRRLAA